VGEAGQHNGQRRSEMTAAAVSVGGLALWRSHPARSCRALCVNRAAAAPSSECIFYRQYICPSVPTQNERDGLAGWGRRRNYPPISRSQSRRSVNDAHPWKLYTPPGIHVPSVWQCDICMPFDTSDRRDNAERTAIDIKAQTPLIQFVVDLLLVCCT